MIETIYADAPLIVCQYLQLATSPYGSNPLAASIAQRVFIDEKPKTSPADAFIVVKDTGDRKRAGAPLTESRIQLDVYGASDAPQSARDIVLKVVFWMHRSRRLAVDAGLFFSAVHSGGGTVIWTPPKERPFIPTYFQVITRTKE